MVLDPVECCPHRVRNRFGDQIMSRYVHKTYGQQGKNGQY